MRYKQLVLLWESASWVDIERLVKLGKLPVFQKICADGTAGRLASVEPINPVTGAVSLATGRAPCDHEIYGNLSLSEDRLRLVQNQSYDWQPIWKQRQLTEQNCICVNWPVTHPATSSGSAVLSDRFSSSGRLAYRYCTPVASVSQSVDHSLTDLLNQARIQPDELSDEVLHEFFECDASELSDQVVKLQLKYLVSQIYTVHAACLLLVEYQQWDCAWFRYSGLLDIIELLNESSLDSNYRDRVYIAFDQLLGVLQSKLDDDVMLHIVSTQAVNSTSPSLTQNRGVWAMRGGSVIKGRVIQGASVLDVAPTIQALRGLSASQCEHEPRKDIFSDLPTGELSEGAELQEGAETDAVKLPWQHLLDDGRVSNLLRAEDRFSIGLIEKTGRYVLEGKFHSLMQMQRFQEAGEAAKRMVDTYPDSPSVLVNFGYCLYAEKKYAELEQYLSTSSLKGASCAVAADLKLLKSRLYLAQGNRSGSSELVGELVHQDDLSALQKLKIAGMYRDLGEPERATGIYEALKTDNPDWIAPQAMLAVLLLKNNHFSQAEKAALLALKIDSTHERMQYTLAMARLRQGNKRLAHAGLDAYVKMTGGTRLINRVLKWSQASD